VTTAPEMKTLRDLLVSAFDVAQDTIPQSARVTHTYHEEYLHSDGKTVLERTFMSQLDDIRLLGVKAEDVLSASVYRYKDSQGRPRRFAMSYVERLQQTSDHLPVVVEISTEAFN
jgi:hypothetical protein